VHLIGFIMRIYHDARSSECQFFISFFVITQRALLFGPILISVATIVT